MFCLQKKNQIKVHDPEAAAHLEVGEDAGPPEDGVYGDAAGPLPEEI